MEIIGEGGVRQSLRLARDETCGAWIVSITRPDGAVVRYVFASEVDARRHFEDWALRGGCGR